MADLRRADLHMHSTASDGALKPSELMRKAYEAGLRCVALTDHDTISGLAEAKKAAKALGLDFISGVEISASVGEEEVHLLGYGFDPADERLSAHFTRLQEQRVERARHMVRKLQEAGVGITYDAVAEAAGGGAVGRPHVAAALIGAGVVADHHEAFQRFLSDGEIGFVPKPPFPASEALEALHRAAGVGVLAHPGHWTASHVLMSLIRDGLDGIEVVHPSHDEMLQNYYRRIAAQYDLLTTGGSDFHRESEKGRTRLGRHTIPYSYVDRLLTRLRQRRNAVHSD